MITKFELTEIENEVTLFLDNIIDFRRDLHRFPELGWEETRTADKICALLEKEGIPYSRERTAITALIEGNKPGHCVALRADIDALPIQEETGLSFSSEIPGKMHACGHDGHTSIMMGAGLWFVRHKDQFSGSVKLLFQPAEESDGGALPMIKAGSLENPRVDKIFGLHVMPYMLPGHVEMKKGALNGSSTGIDITVKGQSGHGAYPESGIDAIMISGHIITAIQSLVSRRVSPLDSAVISLGTIEGGKAGNIIADRVVMKGTMRTADNEQRDLLVQDLKQLVEGTALAHGGQAELEYNYGYSALINTDDEVDLAAAVSREYLGEDNLHWKEKPSMGVEDFSYFLQEVPGCFYHLGCGWTDKSEISPLHSNSFTLNEDCLPIGITLQIGITLSALNNLNQG